MMINPKSLLWLLTFVPFLALHVQAQEPENSKNNPRVGFQTRHGDEIMVCGQHYRIGSRVVLWTDPGGFDAYRSDRRFAPFDQRKWQSTVEEMKSGKLDFVTKPQELHPDRYGLRFERTAGEHYTDTQIDQIRGGGWDLPLLQEKIDQFVLHFDVCGTSAQCFYVLHDLRGLSVHFMLDVDGTIYQTLDLKERAWHATKSNDRSVGIEIANIGAYQVGDRQPPFNRWYRNEENGKQRLIFPDSIRGTKQFQSLALYSRDNEPIRGMIHGREYEQYDFTQQQYDALIKLAAALTDIFPRMKADVPRMPDGKIFTQTLTDEQWASFSGILGHYHIQSNKTDPGPAMDWNYLLDGIQKRLKTIQTAK